MALLDRLRTPLARSHVGAATLPGSVLNVRVVEDTGTFEGDGSKWWASGYAPIIDEDDGGWHYATLREGATSDPRARYCKVAGAHYRPEALRDSRFAPGCAVMLRPEPDNPHGEGHAVGVWDSTGSIQAGYIPHDLSAEITARIRAGEQLAGYVLREFRQGSKSAPRSTIHILVIPIGEELRLDIAE